MKKVLRQHTLGANKKTIEEYLDELVNWDESTREEAAKILGEIGEENVIDPLLRAVMEDESEDVRTAAAFSLANFDEDSTIALKLAESFLKESSPMVRFALANTIGDLGSVEAAKKMTPILKEEEVIWVREAILEALGKNPSQDFVDIILDSLKSDAAEEVRVQAALALQKFPKFYDLSTILNIFSQEKSDIVKSHIVELIAEFPDITSVELLSEALDDDKNTLTKAAVAEALHKIALALGFSDENEMMDSL